MITKGNLSAKAVGIFIAGLHGLIEGKGKVIREKIRNKSRESWSGKAWDGLGKRHKLN